jgi:tRNA 2-thiouridine synthesizing protein A
MTNRYKPGPSDEAGEPMTDLDALGYKCPLPALMTRRALARLPAGACLSVVADDPMAAIDIPHLAQQLGHELVSAREDGAHLRFVIRKRAGARSRKPGRSTRE